MGRRLYSKKAGWFGSGYKRDRAAERKADGGSFLPGGFLTRLLLVLVAVIVAAEAVATLVHAVAAHR